MKLCPSITSNKPCYDDQLIVPICHRILNWNENCSVYRLADRSRHWNLYVCRLRNQHTTRLSITHTTFIKQSQWKLTKSSTHIRHYGPQCWHNEARFPDDLQNAQSSDADELVNAALTKFTGGLQKWPSVPSSNGAFPRIQLKMASCSLDILS